MAFELTAHARNRCNQRKIPEYVLAGILDGAFIAQAREEDGKISNFRIVRVANRRYWVGIERDDVIITVIPVGFEQSAYFWFKRRILNFRHLIGSIESIPLTRAPKPSLVLDENLAGALVDPPARARRRNERAQITAELAARLDVDWAMRA